MKNKLVAILIGVAVGLLAAWMLVGNPFEHPLPPPPEIALPRGAMPVSTVAFEERIEGRLSGSGFYLALSNGSVVGVTTAHSMGRNFVGVEFRRASDGAKIGQFTKLWVPFSDGPPEDMTNDYAVMTPDQQPDASIVLEPDPRGGPQPGERVSLYSGLGGEGTVQRVLEGTVVESAPGQAWVRMDTVFQPQLMSGSPFLSQHTGKVVGVTTSLLLAPGPVTIGICPIRVAVRAATAGSEHPEGRAAP